MDDRLSKINLSELPKPTIQNLLRNLQSVQKEKCICATTIHLGLHPCWVCKLKLIFKQLSELSDNESND